MAGGFIAGLQKGKFLSMIDQELKVPSASMIEELESRKSLLEIGKDTKILRDSDRFHVEEEVLGNVWWRDFASKEAIVRAGYIEAIRLSLRHAEETGEAALPIVSYWVAGPPTFNISLAKTEQQIVLLLLTPQAPPLSPNVPASAAVEEDIWIVASEETVDGVVGSFPESWEVSKEDVVAAGISGVRKVRTKGL